nr:alpha-amylase family glycosyl hydrolase [Segatella maculosa]
MKRFYTLILMTLAALGTFAQGWPEKYDGVMLQGFYWDSYADSDWKTLTNQADELSKYFNLIWIPNSGNTSDFYHSHRKTMGYDPCFWLNHNSCWGTEAELRDMIRAFRSKGTGFVEDVVINHKNGLNAWADFAQENVTGPVTGKTYKVEWDNTNYSQICSTDEANRNPNSGVAAG